MLARLVRRRLPGRPQPDRRDRRRRADVLRGVPRVLAAARAEGRLARGSHRRDRRQAGRASASAGRSGDTIPMRSNIWTQKDGGNVWPMKIAGIYDATNGDNQSLYFHYDYLNESRSFGARSRSAGSSMRVEDPDHAGRRRAHDRRAVRQLLDRDQDRDRESVHPGLRQPDGQHRRALTAVATAVFFTMLLVTANTMGQSIRERINEIARHEDARVLQRRRHGAGARRGSAGDGARRRHRPRARGAASRRASAQAMQQFFPVLGMPPSTYVDRRSTDRRARRARRGTAVRAGVRAEDRRRIEEGVTMAGNVAHADRRHHRR